MREKREGVTCYHRQQQRHRLRTREKLNTTHRDAKVLFPSPLPSWGNRPKVNIQACAKRTFYRECETPAHYARPRVHQRNAESWEIQSPLESTEQRSLTFGIITGLLRPRTLKLPPPNSQSTLRTPDKTQTCNYKRQGTDNTAKKTTTLFHTNSLTRFSLRLLTKAVKKVKTLKSTCGARSTDRTRRTPPWRSTSAGTSTGTRGWSHRSTPSTCARGVPRP